MKFFNARHAIHQAYSIHLGSPNMLEPLVATSTKHNALVQILNSYEAGHIISAVESLPANQKEMLLLLYAPDVFMSKQAHGRCVQLLVDRVISQGKYQDLSEAEYLRLYALMACQLDNYQALSLRGKPIFSKPYHYQKHIKQKFKLTIEAEHFARKWDLALSLGFECIEEIEKIALPKVAAAVHTVQTKQAGGVNPIEHVNESNLEAELAKECKRLGIVA